MNIIYIFFNRPDKVRASFPVIRNARPSRLFLVSDGPRTGRVEDVAKVRECREYVKASIDWDCDVVEDYAEANLGCGKRVASGITSAFAQCGEAIVLEDDCIADEAFFDFCVTMLERYREDSRVMVITGNNFQQGAIRGAGAYYYSKYPHCWGWATWKRAWQYFDATIPFWPSIRESQRLRSVCPNPEEYAFWTKVFDRFYGGGIDTWDYPWLLCVWMQRGITVTPNANLVANVGFGSDATHTHVECALTNLPTGKLAGSTPPEGMLLDVIADEFTAQTVYGVEMSKRSRRFRFARSCVRRLRKLIGQLPPQARAASAPELR